MTCDGAYSHLLRRGDRLLQYVYPLATLPRLRFRGFTLQPHRHTIGVNRRELLQVGYPGLLGVGLTSPAAEPPSKESVFAFFK